MLYVISLFVSSKRVMS